MALRTEPEWKTFLIAAGIPEAEATTYSQKLVQNRLTEVSLPELSKQILTDLEITVLGDQMGILAHAKKVTTPGKGFEKFLDVLSNECHLDLINPFSLNV